MQELSLELVGGFDPPLQSLSKKGFAEHLGVTPGRISQLIEQGLPVEPTGRIDIAKGTSWYAANVDPNRRRAGGADAPTANLRDGTSRDEREIAEARIATLKAGKLAGELIDRKAALAAIEARGRIERDAWLGWVNRVAPELARTFDAPLSEVTPLLDRLVRDQVASLASMPAPEVTRD